MNDAPVRVLVADDEDDIRQWLELMIGSEESPELFGSATDAEEAVRLAEERKPARDPRRGQVLRPSAEEERAG